MKLHEVARVVIEILARVAPERHLTRITVMEDQLNPAVAPGWFRVAIGNGTIGVTEILSPDRASDAEDMQMFVERLLARLEYALAETSAFKETAIDASPS